MKSRRPPLADNPKPPVGRVPSRGAGSGDPPYNAPAPVGPVPSPGVPRSTPDNGGVALGDLCELRVAQDGPKGKRDFVYVDISSIDRETKGIVNPKILALAKAPSRARQVLQAGDVLVSMTRPNLNAVAILPSEFGDAIGSTGFHVLRSKDADPRFLFYAVQTPEFIAAMCHKVQGALYPAVRPKDISSFRVPRIALDDQRRIVAEIEKQFTRLDAGVAALRRVQANLKRYRAAVLKAACEGRLVTTEAELARKEGRSYERGDDLLQRILRERRERWGEASANGIRKYRDPAARDGVDLPPLPQGWVWGTLDAIADVKGGITKDQKRRHTAPARLVAYLRVANVQRGYLDLSEVKQILATKADIQELALKPGDILFNEGGDRDKLGRGWIWNDELPECIHQNHVFRARLFDARMNPKFVSWYGNTFGQQFFFDEGKHTTNLASISMTKLRRLPVPVPPAAEQTRIVAEVERRLSVVGELEALVSANLQRAARLRQTILQKAFSGRF